MPALRARILLFWPLAAAGALYMWFWPLVTPDIGGSYVPWLQHIQATGPVRAFAAPFGDYAPPYLYLLALLSLGTPFLSAVTVVKLVAVVGTGFLTLATHRLLRAVGAPEPWRYALFVPLLPGVALNASLMASADALWAAPCVLALACAAERRHVAMLAWCGVALAIKQQALFAAPVILGVLLARRVPIRLWFVTPAAFLAMYLPAWAAGWPLGNLLTVYIRQAAACPDLSLSAPNLWAIVQRVPGIDGTLLTGVALLIAAAAALALSVRVATMRLDGTGLVTAALLSPLLVVGLLPRMHERYFFLADILALAAAAVAGTRRASADALLVQLGSTLGILAYLSGIGGLACLGAVAMICATVRVLRGFWPTATAEPASVLA